MNSESERLTESANREGDARRSQAISLDQAAAIANEIQGLIQAGHQNLALSRLRQLHPADIASIVGGLPPASRDALVRLMSPETVAWMLRQMNPVAASRLGTRLGSKTLSFVLGQVHPQQALQALRRLPLPRAREVAETLRQPLADPDILTLKPNTAGSLMTTRFPAVSIDDSASEARSALAELGDEGRKFSNVLVLEQDGSIAGQIALVDLALSDHDAPARDITTPTLAAVTSDVAADECARLRLHYNLAELPVIEDGVPVGIILADSLHGAAVEQDTRQMLQVASVAGETLDGPLSDSVRTRLPWLTINLATTFLAAATVALFESTLMQVVALAAFLPVVAGQGGIGGTQTLTLIVRSIALGELVGITARRLLIREAILGILHGAWLGILVAGVAILWKQNVGLGLVLGLAMLGNMVIAGSVGAGVPLMLRRAGVDPAVASAVLVTTVTDVFGFLLFLGIATAALSLIV